MAGAGEGKGRGGWFGEWDVERRFLVTEVALAILWVCLISLSLGGEGWRRLGRRKEPVERSERTWLILGWMT